MFKIQTLNKISVIGLDKFPRDTYEVASEINNPDAILVRSADMHEMALSENVKAVARAGAGTNNIPCDKLAEKGVVVFNTPGANANAVKELVILALLLSSRPAIAANKWVESELAGKGDEIAALAEKGKSKFVGPELKGKTLGVIGLGAIGNMVANTAIALFEGRPCPRPHRENRRDFGRNLHEGRLHHCPRSSDERDQGND